MNEQRLEELAEKLKTLLKEYGVEEEGFQLKVFVSQSYYDSIKNNFSKRNPLDVIVETHKDDWAIAVMYLPPMPTKM